MENTYIFIIWHNALWCQNKIVKDLKQHFDILNDFYITWSNSNLEKNYLALYGRKLGPASNKIFTSGKGEFRFLLIKDNCPKYETRKMYDGDEVVNANIYDIKTKYRKWTAGAHRIHCSDTQKETLHDLVVLFGPNYESILADNKHLIKDTIAINGFKNIRELDESLSLFGDNIHKIEGNNIQIMAKCRFDIISFLNPQIKINDFEYQIYINRSIYNLTIFGELDGDVPQGITNHFSNDYLPAVIFNSQSYIDYLNERNSMPSEIENLFRESGLSTLYKKNNPTNQIKAYSLKEKLVLLIKLVLKKYL